MIICHFAGKNLNEPLVLFGDIAMPHGLQNADPCINRGCLWPKASDGNVYVPYTISSVYCKAESLLLFSIFGKKKNILSFTFYEMVCI